MFSSSNVKHYFSFSDFFLRVSSCELSDYGWFRIENEKLQTEKFNPSRAVIEIAVGRMGMACIVNGSELKVWGNGEELLLEIYDFSQWRTLIMDTSWLEQSHFFPSSYSRVSFCSATYFEPFYFSLCVCVCICVNLGEERWTSRWKS